MRPIGFLMLLFALTACQTMVVGDEDSPSYPPPAGSRFTLRQPLTIPADSAHVIMQKGRVVSLRALDLYRPACSLYLKTVRDTDQTVEPDEFVVTRANRMTTFVAQAGFVYSVGLAGQDGGPTVLLYRTVLDLKSSRQPNVRRLVCERWDHPALGNHLSIQEIRQALGDIMTLTLPDRATGQH